MQIIYGQLPHLLRRLSMARGGAGEESVEVFLVHKSVGKPEAKEKSRRPRVLPAPARRSEKGGFPAPAYYRNMDPRVKY